MTARHLSLTLSVLLVSTSFAETDLTPELAVALALEKNAAIAVASARVVAAEGLRTQAGLKPNHPTHPAIRKCATRRRIAV